MTEPAPAPEPELEADSPRRHRRANAIGQLLPLIMGYGLTFVSTPIVVSALGVRGFGIWAISGAFAQYAALLDFGMGRGVTRFVALHRAEGDFRREGQVVTTALLVICTIALVLPVVTWLIAPALRGALSFDTDHQARVVLGSSAVILGFGMIATTLCSASFGKGRMVNGNIASSLSKASSVIGGLVALAVSPTLDSFAIGNAIGAVAGLGVCIVFLATVDRGIASGPPSMDIVRQQLNYGFKGQLEMVSNMVVFQSDKIIIGLVVGPTAAGAYELGNRLASAAREVALRTAWSMTPEFTHTYARSGLDGVRDPYLSLTRVTTGLSSLPLLFVAATAPLLLDAWLGDAPGLSVTVTVTLCLVSTLNASAALTSIAAQAIGRPGLPAVASWTGALVNVALAIPLTLLIGTEGVLFAIGAAVVVGAVTAFVLFGRVVDVPLRKVVRAMDSYLVGLPLAAVFALVAFAIPQPDRLVGLALVAALGLLFVATYVPIGIRLGFLPRLRRAR